MMLGDLGKNAKARELCNAGSRTCACYLHNTAAVLAARHSSGDGRGGDVALPLTEEPLTATEKETHLSLGWGGLW